MRPECAFFPGKAIFFHIPAPVHLLLLNPLNCLLSCPCSASTLLQHTFQPGASFLHRRAWYGQPNLQYILPILLSDSAHIVPSAKAMSRQWGLWHSLGEYHWGSLNERYDFSVSLCAIESSYVLCCILIYCEYFLTLGSSVLTLNFHFLILSLEEQIFLIFKIYLFLIGG